MRILYYVIGIFWCIKMSITVEVRLLSGKTATVSAGLNETVATLKCRAQAALGVRNGRLVASSGNLVAEWIHFTLFGVILPTIKLKVCTFGGL